jgi:hypothetical protein
LPSLPGCPESRVPSLEYRAPSPDYRAPCPESRVSSIERRVPSIERRVPCPESRVSSAEYRAWRHPATARIGRQKHAQARAIAQQSAAIGHNRPILFLPRGNPAACLILRHFSERSGPCAAKGAKARAFRLSQNGTLRRFRCESRFAFVCVGLSSSECLILRHRFGILQTAQHKTQARNPLKLLDRTK